jgi:hypothetical protein
VIDIDSVLERYLRAVRAAGAPEADPIASAADVERVVMGVSPYIVPPDVQRAWRRLSRSDWLVDSGELLSPTTALDMMWPGSAHAFDQPRLLFPISYASHTFLYVELGVAGGPPGGALLLAPIAEPLIRHAPSLAWALDFVSRRVEAGAAHWNEWWTNEISEQEVQLAAAGQVWPPYLLPTIDPSRSLSWPAHWQQAEGINPADATPRGPNTKIAAMFALGPGATCRIQGRIVALAAAAVGSRIAVADDSGEAIVWVARSADPFGVVGMRDWVELEIIVGQPREEPSEQIFAEIAASPIPPDEEEAKRIAVNAMAMFDAASYRFRATIARPVER